MTSWRCNTIRNVNIIIQDILNFQYIYKCNLSYQDLLLRASSLLTVLWTFLSNPIEVLSVGLVASNLIQFEILRINYMFHSSDVRKYIDIQLL